MKVKCGVDIIEIDRIKNSIDTLGEKLFGSMDENTGLIKFLQKMKLNIVKIKER